jgi:hypothetical protein
MKEELDVLLRSYTLVHHSCVVFIPSFIALVFNVGVLIYEIIHVVKTKLNSLNGQEIYTVSSRT